jgi:hypothetical protein
MTAPVATIEKIRLEANKPNESAQPDRFALTWADHVYEASAPLEFLVGEDRNGLITKGSVNLLVGEGGSKKTWAALDLAVCVAMGEKWLDFPTRQTAVLIVDEESGPRRLQRRLFETLNGHLVQREDAPPIAFTSLNLLDMRNPEDVNALHVKILESNAGLVIIDALADIMPGADENAVKDVQPVFMQLRRVAETTQAAIVVIHHSNKQNGYRGSTAIKGAVDLMLMVDSTPESKYITFSADKARDIEPRKFTAAAYWQAEKAQFYLTATEVNPKAQTSKAQRFVLRFLADNPNAEMAEITNAADVCTPNTARQAVYNLVDSGHVQKTGTGKVGRGNKQQFDLTDKGRDALDGDE